MANTKNAEKQPIISIARVLGMFFILLCHTLPHLTFIPFNNYFRQFFNCGVIIFFFISGYLFGGKNICSLKTWFMRRFLSVSFPTIVLSILVITILLCINEKISLTTVIAYLIDAEGLLFLSWRCFSNLFNEIPSLAPLWFTTLIILCYLCVPLLQRLSKHINNKPFSLWISLVLSIIIAVILSPFVSLFYFIYFFVGYFLGINQYLSSVNSIKFVLHSIIAFVLLIGRLLLHRFVHASLIYTNYVSFSHFFLGTWFLSLIALLYDRFPIQIYSVSHSRIVSFLDDYSFYFYLTHGLFCAGPFNLFNHLSLPLALLSFIICTVAVSLLIKRLCAVLLSVRHRILS